MPTTAVTERGADRLVAPAHRPRGDAGTRRAVRRRLVRRARPQAAPRPRDAGFVGNDFGLGCAALLAHATTAYPETHVSKYPHPPQLRATRDRRGGPRRRASVRAQDLGVDQALAGERRGVRARRRQRSPTRPRRLLDSLVTNAPREGPRGRGREAPRPRAGALRGLSAPADELPEHVRRNRAHWDEWAEDYVAPAERNWSADEPTWGIWGVPEADVGMIPDDVGRDGRRSSSAAEPPTSRPGSRGAAPSPSASTTRRRSSPPRGACRPSTASSSR